MGARVASPLMTDVVVEQPPRAHARIVYLGPVSPHWEVYGDWGDRTRARRVPRPGARPPGAAAPGRPPVPAQPGAHRARCRAGGDHPRVGSRPPRRGVTTAADSATVAAGPSTDDRFINRELSWLDFNDRVLHLAAEGGMPLLERAKFCAIFSTNLDEFFQVRVAALKDQIAAGITRPAPDGLTPSQQLVDDRRAGRRARRRPGDALLDAPGAGPRARRHRHRQLGRARRRRTQGPAGDLEQRIFPVLTPLAVDPAHPFPYISNLALSLAVMVRDPQTGERRASPGSRCRPSFPGSCRCPTGALRAGRGRDRGAADLAVQRHGDRRGHDVPGHPQRRPHPRGGGGRRPPGRRRDGAAPPPLRRRRPARGRATDHPEDARPAGARARARARRRRRTAGPDRPRLPVAAASVDRPDLKDEPWPPVTAGRSSPPRTPTARSSR